ncbi:MAG: serine hydrolase domain-containing protein [Gammaproteobacteria bacterium]
MSVDLNRLHTARGVLDNAVDSGDLVFASGLIGDKTGALMVHAAGSRDADGALPAGQDSIFAIASMTKLVTTIAALQLVEAGKLDLDNPLNHYLPELHSLSVLQGFRDDGEPVYVPASRAPTARELITHTSGFVYSIWNEDAFSLQAKGLTAGVGSGRQMLNAPLAFQPGTDWEYGIGTDWLGYLVEQVSGQRLMGYFAEHIFKPLGMVDTTFEFEVAKIDRAVSMMARVEGELVTSPAMQPIPEAPGSADFYGGGGGLYSTLTDYSQLLAAMLNQGKGANGSILQPQTVAAMFQHQLGDLSVKHCATQMPALSHDLDVGFGSPATWGLGLLLHTDGTGNGRSAGSGSWAGLFNSYFWIDREREVFGIFATQVLPFLDPKAVATMTAFERAIYGVSD